MREWFCQRRCEELRRVAWEVLGDVLEVRWVSGDTWGRWGGEWESWSGGDLDNGVVRRVLWWLSAWG